MELVELAESLLGQRRRCEMKGGMSVVLLPGIPSEEDVVGIEIPEMFMEVIWQRLYPSRRFLQARAIGSKAFGT